MPEAANIAGSTELTVPRSRASCRAASRGRRAGLDRAAASLDILSGGRVELGLGAGAFWDAVAAMGGPRRTPGEATEALEEAIALIRALWTPGRAVTFAGQHYQLRGAQPGPIPPHPIGIWLGSYKPRMLRLTGRLADKLSDALLSHLAYEEDDLLPALGRSSIAL